MLYNSIVKSLEVKNNYFAFAFFVWTFSFIYLFKEGALWRRFIPSDLYSFLIVFIKLRVLIWLSKNALGGGAEGLSFLAASYGLCPSLLPLWGGRGAAKN